MSRRGTPVPSSELLDHVWGPSFRGDDAYLATWIYRLRHKLEPDPNHPSLVITVRGDGYQFSE